MSAEQPPSIAALFLIVFDRTRGYTIAWSRSLQSVILEGVDFKCLPSGLHSVREDIVYFTHGAYAGVSAFAAVDAGIEHRGRQFVAVGALVKAHQREPLGHSWLCIETLRALAQASATTSDRFEALEEAWERLSIKTSASQSINPDGPEGVDPLHGSAFVSGNNPALSVVNDLESLGPLLFPLYREALLRKCILIYSPAPVLPVCNMIHSLFSFSQISHDLRPSSQDHRLISTPLFSVGLTDIGILQSATTSWIACTTEKVLTEKRDLFDIVVDLSPDNGRPQPWPEVRSADSRHLRATRRDARRFIGMQRELARHRRPVRNTSDIDDESTDEDDRPAGKRESMLRFEDGSLSYSPSAASALVEPETWTAAAYNSLLWWASATDADEAESEETITDHALLQDITLPELLTSNVSIEEPVLARRRESQTVAFMVRTYFRRWTERLITAIDKIVEAHETQGTSGYYCELSGDDLRSMGLDEWSPGDRQFVRDFLRLHFATRVGFKGEEGWEICGVKI
nr:hypothetical protein B0A51_15151 [Rachicladosporium sp. CCFEE 5018]